MVTDNEYLMVTDTEYPMVTDTEYQMVIYWYWILDRYWYWISDRCYVSERTFYMYIFTVHIRGYGVVHTGVRSEKTEK